VKSSSNESRQLAERVRGMGVTKQIEVLLDSVPERQCSPEAVAAAAAVLRKIMAEHYPTAVVAPEGRFPRGPSFLLNLPGVIELSVRLPSEDAAWLRLSREIYERRDEEGR
jgi:hypothetical protein